MIDFNSLKPGYTSLLADTTITPWGVIEATKAYERILVAKPRYLSTSAKTNVPWHIIAILHLMEGGLDFGTYLGNGESLKHKTTMVPRGRGPFDSWELGAIDALHYQNMDRITDWSDEEVLYQVEKFNGFGYRLYHSINSPYLWSGTNHYSRGKYLEKPGVHSWFDPNAVSKQIGAVPVLLKLKESLNVSQ